MDIVELQTSEKINEKHLLKFVIINLKNQNIFLNKNNKLYISYIQELNLYKIFILESKEISDIFFYKPKYSEEILLSEDFFVFYKDYKVYYYQKLSNINIEDIKTYMKKNFNIDDVRFSYIKDVTINKNKSLYYFYRPYKSKLFKIFIIYLLFLFSFFYFYESKGENEGFNSFTKDLELNKKNIEYKYVTKDIVEIFNKAKQNGIEILNLEYKSSHFFAIFTLENQKTLDNFFKGFSFYKIEKIEQNKNLKILVANVYFKFD